MATKFDPTGTSFGDMIDAVGRAVAAFIRRIEPGTRPGNSRWTSPAPESSIPAPARSLGTPRCDQRACSDAPSHAIGDTLDEHRGPPLVLIQRVAVISNERGGQHWRSVRARTRGQARS